MGDLIEVRMTRPDLDEIPEASLPEGFALRWFEPGDVEQWARIQLSADPSYTVDQAFHEREFGVDPALLAQRQAFLVGPGGELVGTASAWLPQPPFGPEYSRVHWVAIVDGMQGRGLAKPLLSAVMRRMKDLGHTRAYLTTENFRVPAINMYLKYGFSPHILTDEDRRAWQPVREAGLDIVL